MRTDHDRAGTHHASATMHAADDSVVFFVTARPEIIDKVTELNLSLVDYHWTDLYTRTTLDFSDTRP
ncbi:HAD family hydrolase [Couchioplanes caeruleus]|uniref:Uncharacterized protein n=1 Tax=Couchioplanes caeruleus subsp. caeruleus TaxID=56427 RepID=A0A1K0GWT6_9ACTN|nr:hypothetical protein [Couchioplanes caeruleus]OJF15860.1 hypothetical protein BG844_02210 [Couchioplanes caeruleus subsp. caeruleus]